MQKHCKFYEKEKTMNVAQTDVSYSLVFIVLTLSIFVKLR